MHVRRQHGAPITRETDAAHGVSDPVPCIASRMRTRAALSSVRRRRRISGITETTVITGTAGIPETTVAPAAAHTDGPCR
jgi:hypothetical protein